MVQGLTARHCKVSAHAVDAVGMRSSRRFFVVAGGGGSLLLLRKIFESSDVNSS